jgi:hypothetical protein
MPFGAAPMLKRFAFSTRSLPPSSDSLNWDIISRRFCVAIHFQVRPYDKRQLYPQRKRISHLLIENTLTMPSLISIQTSRGLPNLALTKATLPSALQCLHQIHVHVIIFIVIAIPTPLSITFHGHYHSSTVVVVFALALA